MSKNIIRIATRKSPLALWQAGFIKEQLIQLYPHIAVQIIPFVTEGDRLLSAKLADFGGKGLFVKELEHALLTKAADIAVHSMKDVPTYFPQKLKLGAICKRDDPRDVLISNRYTSLESLPSGVKIGTASLRRKCQLKRFNQQFEIVNLRGNVDSRLQKLDAGEFDAIILAAAGIKRLGHLERIRAFLPIELFIPAVGQGIIGIECHEEDDAILDLIEPLNDLETAACVIAERATAERLGGGCHAPIAAYATLEKENLLLRGMVSSALTYTYIEAEARGSDPQAVGFELAEKLLTQGADRLLKECFSC